MILCCTNVFWISGKPPDDDDDDDVFDDDERPLVINHIDEDDQDTMNNHTNGPFMNSMSPRQHNGLSPTDIKLANKKPSAVNDHNTKLRDLAIREVRRPGKSEYK